MVSIVTQRKSTNHYKAKLKEVFVSYFLIFIVTIMSYPYIELTVLSYSMIVFVEYTILGGDEELPLGEEFQSLVRCFIHPNEKKTVKRYEWTGKLIENL